MAGSYRHVVDGNNEFIGTKHIESNLDACESLEECHAMIEYLTGGDKQKIFEAWLEGYAKKNIPPENIQNCTFDRFWK